MIDCIIKTWRGDLCSVVKLYLVMPLLDGFKYKVLHSIKSCKLTHLDVVQRVQLKEFYFVPKYEFLLPSFIWSYMLENGGFYHKKVTSGANGDINTAHNMSTYCRLDKSV